MGVKKFCHRLYGVICVTSFFTISLISFSCGQNSSLGKQPYHDETVSVKEKFTTATSFTVWETSCFEERQLTGEKKSSVNSKDFLVVFPAEKGLYPEYPGIGTLDYSTCTPAIIEILKKTGDAATSGIWPEDLFVPTDISTVAYYNRVTEHLLTGTTYLYSQPYFTDDDAFEAVFLLKGSEKDTYLTVYYIFLNEKWCIDDLIQDIP